MKNTKITAALMAMTMMLSTASAIPAIAATTLTTSASVASVGTSSFNNKKVTVKKKYTVGTKSATISWNKLTGATGYRIYRYDTVNKKWVKLKTTKKTSYQDTTLKPGNIYKYCVKAYKKYNGKTYWSKKSITKVISTKPNKTTIKASEITDSTAKLTWNQVNCDGYVIMKQGDDGTYNKVKTIKGKTKTSVSLIDLKSGSEYSYGIKAYKSDKNGKTNYSKLTTIDFTTDKKDESSWTDNLNSVDRAYYNFMRNSFSNNDWNIMVEDMTNYVKNNFEGKSGNIKLNESGRYLYPDEYTEYYAAMPMKFKYGSTVGGYLPGTSWQNEPIESYEDVLIFKSWAYANIEGTIARLIVDGWFDDYSEYGLDNDPAPIGFKYSIDNTINGPDPTINVIYG